MLNDISLTVRLPHELNKQLSSISKSVGMTKTSLIRSAIHDFLTVDSTVLDFSADNANNKKDRLVLNINQLAHTLLEASCQKHNQSMNAVITAVSILALERATKWLGSLQQ